MKFYPADSIVEVEVAFNDLNGQPITPTSVSAVLFDGEDNEIENFGSIPFDPAAGSVTVVVPRIYNELDSDETRAVRVLRVSIGTVGGEIIRSLPYALEAEQRLEIIVNTFQTYETAQVAMKDMVNMSGWTAANDDQRRAALVEAFRRITMMPLKYGVRDTHDKLNFREEHYITREDWIGMSAEDFKKLPDHFRQALRRAQLIEANELLQGDAVARKRRAGIVSETIGESSMTIRADRVDYGLNPQTMAALAGYIHFNMRITRA